jgi:nucleoid-associated protein YgaU
MSTDQNEITNDDVTNVSASLESERSEEKVIFWIVGALAVLALLALLITQFGGGEKSEIDVATFSGVEPVTVSEPKVEKKIDEPVVTKPAEKTEIVSVDPKPEKEVEPEPEIEIVAKPVEETKPATIAPSFDIVRVDREGSAIIAGSAEPNSEIRLTVDGQELDVAKSDATGAFAFVTTMPDGVEPMQLQLEEVGDTLTKSVETVLVMPSPKGEKVTPKVVIAEADGQVLVQEQGELGPQVQPLSLDTINYSASGDVVLSGRGTSQQSVRVYVDNEPVVLGQVNDGNWRFEIPDIEEGLYTVRVDAVDEQGKVIERVESPFQRVIAQMEAGEVTIQPGFTLWQLAELKYGSGDRYVQIFDANRDSIKDPDMIFPGQVFEVPDK